MISSEFTVLSGNTNSELSNLICNRLGIKLGNCNVVQMSNRETVVDIGDSVRGRNVFIIQTISKNVNNSLMELLILTYACKTSSARQIVGVIPYLPYCKQSKMRKRGCIVSKLLAQMLCKAGMTHAITIDLHQKEIQGFFDIPIDNLRASPFLIHYIQTSIPDYRNAVIVAKNPASAKRAQSYAERLRLGLAVIHGEQKEAEEDEIDGRQSPPTIPRASDSTAATSRSLVTSADGTIGDVDRNVAVGAENGVASESINPRALATRLSSLRNAGKELGRNESRVSIKSEAQTYDTSSHNVENVASPDVGSPVINIESAVDVVKSDEHDIVVPGETSLIDRMEISKSDLFGSFHYLPILTQKEKPPLNVVGDVGGRIAIMVDDIIDEPDVFISAAELLKERGAYKIYLMATHGIFSGDSPTLLQESPIDLIVVTNTVPHEIQKMQCTKIETIDISMLLSEAIRRIHYQESMSHLFRNISTTD